MGERDEQLCGEVFQAVRLSPPARGSYSLRWRGPADQDWAAGEELETGGRTVGGASLRNWLLLETEGRLAAWADSLAERLFGPRLPFESLAGWGGRWAAVRDHLFLQFFRWNSDRPALVWATPLWFLNTNPLPRGAAVADRLRDRRNLGPKGQAAAKVQLSLGKDRALVLPPRLFQFHYDDGQRRENQSAPVVVHSPRRREIKVPGRHKVILTEDALSLACPGGPRDEPLLQAGKIPVHWSYYERGPGGPYLRSSVVTLAVLEPMDESRRRAWVDHLTIFFFRGDARLLEISAATGRDFAGFVEHHPGLRAVLQRRLARGE